MVDLRRSKPVFRGLRWLAKPCLRTKAQNNEKQLPERIGNLRSKH